MAVLECVAGETADTKRLKTFNPSSLAPIGDFETATRTVVETAVANARVAQQSWCKTSFKERAACLQRALQLLVEQKEAYVDVITDETGRSRFETLFFEILPACDVLNFFSRNAETILRPSKPGLHLLRLKKAKILYKPLGVVGVISPWNGPFILSLNPTVQALMAGNAVVLKPSEVTPFAGQLVERLFRDAGLPEGVLQVVLGDGTTGAALVESEVDKISFTGSEATGRKVGEACGRRLTPCTLELGGKDSMIVLDDADLVRTAKGAVFGAFVNNGQFCCGTERVYVVESIADAFIEKVLAEVGSVAVGGDFGVGPFISAPQLDIVEGQLKDAIDKGATILSGGKRATEVGPYHFEPTVLTNVTADMRIMQEETFGPIMPIVRVKDEAEAIAKANSVRFGLSSNVWTKDAARADRVAAQLETGSVCVNDCAITYGALEVPFGGAKASGVGYVNGEAGLRGYCQAFPIIHDRFGLKEEQVWFPYTEEKMTTIEKAIASIWGTRIGRWFIG